MCVEKSLFEKRGLNSSRIKNKSVQGIFLIIVKDLEDLVITGKVRHLFFEEDERMDSSMG